NKSGVFKIVHGNNSFLFVGDAEYPAERILMKSYGRFLDSDILKVGHHGSNSSSTHEFLEYVSPDYAVISVGTKNRYNHPDNQIIYRLEKSTEKLFRTDLDGAVIFTYGGNSLNIKTIVSEKEIIDFDI
ncbi:MAG TPA: MBL fold metallo-hydrolase, partial [Candidatus Cloacimonetes bacterium]|nr:MBL fold metallo-hydrolase [Candidatus Cloacimonadota bacterium]